MYKNVFFDLDGTLTQSEFGIINSVLYALNKMGIEESDPQAVKRFIGPPLLKAFKEFYQMSDSDAEKATAIYREYYSAGEMFNAPLYPGIENALKTLHEKGHKLYVVTSKPTVYAKRIVEHFEVLKYFESVIGPELGNKDYTKEELVRAAIKEAAGDGEINLDDYIMIGDRFYDIDGAKANSIASIGVLYGYGNRKELEEAGATYIAETAEMITKIVTEGSI